MRKKQFILLISAIIILLGTLSITHAYYLMAEDTKSIITFGNVKLKLIEKELQNGEYIDIGSNDSVDITNITKLNRIVKVKNVGNNPFYLRLKIEFNGTSNGNDYTNYNNLITINANEGWQYQEGYYYYKIPLNPNEETNDLMKEIQLDNNNIANNYKGYKFYLKIKAEAVQSEHNVDNVMEVTNWPN